MGVGTVAVYSDLDRDALHVRMADEAYSLGGQTAAESYLNTGAILGAIERSGADSVHPGYGFFSENPDFARSITDDGITFIGPGRGHGGHGDKISSRIAAAAVGSPASPVVRAAQLARRGGDLRQRERVAGGHQGRLRRWGPRHEGGPLADEAVEAVDSAQREAQAYFGRPEIYLERYLAWPRHIECRSWRTPTATWCGWASGTARASAGTRSSSRRAPPRFPDEVRQAMGAAAVMVTRACGYLNAARSSSCTRTVSSTSWR